MPDPIFLNLFINESLHNLDHILLLDDNIQNIFRQNFIIEPYYIYQAKDTNYLSQMYGFQSSGYNSFSNLYFNTKKMGYRGWAYGRSSSKIILRKKGTRIFGQQFRLLAFTDYYTFGTKRRLINPKAYSYKKGILNFWENGLLRERRLWYLMGRKRNTDWLFIHKKKKWFKRKWKKVFGGKPFKRIRHQGALTFSYFSNYLEIKYDLMGKYTFLYTKGSISEIKKLINISACIFVFIVYSLFNFWGIFFLSFFLFVNWLGLFHVFLGLLFKVIKFVFVLVVILLNHVRWFCFYSWRYGPFIFIITRMPEWNLEFNLFRKSRINAHYSGYYRYFHYFLRNVILFTIRALLLRFILGVKLIKDYILDLNFFLKILILSLKYLILYAVAQAGSRLSLQIFWKIFFTIKINLYIIFHIDFFYGLFSYYNKLFDVDNLGHYISEISDFWRDKFTFIFSWNRFCASKNFFFEIFFYCFNFLILNVLKIFFRIFLIKPNRITISIYVYIVQNLTRIFFNKNIFVYLLGFFVGKSFSKYITLSAILSKVNILLNNLFEGFILGIILLLNCVFFSIYFCWKKRIIHFLGLLLILIFLDFSLLFNFVYKIISGFFSHYIPDAQKMNKIYWGTGFPGWNERKKFSWSFLSYMESNLVNNSLVIPGLRLHYGESKLYILNVNLIYYYMFSEKNFRDKINLKLWLWSFKKPVLRSYKKKQIKIYFRKWILKLKQFFFLWFYFWILKWSIFKFTLIKKFGYFFILLENLTRFKILFFISFFFKYFFLIFFWKIISWYLFFNQIFSKINYNFKFKKINFFPKFIFSSNFYNYYSGVLLEFCLNILFLNLKLDNSTIEFWKFYFYICFGNFYVINLSIKEFFQNSFLGKLRMDTFTFIVLFFKVYVYWIVFFLVFLLKNVVFNFQLNIGLNFENNFLLNLVNLKSKVDNLLDYLSVTLDWLKSKLLYHRDLISPKNRRRKLFRKRRARFFKNRKKKRYIRSYLKNDLWGFFTKNKNLHKRLRVGFFSRVKAKRKRFKKLKKFSMFFNLNTAVLLNNAYKKSGSLKGLKYTSNRRVLWFRWFLYYYICIFVLILFSSFWATNIFSDNAEKTKNYSLPLIWTQFRKESLEDLKEMFEDPKKIFIENFALTDSMRLALNLTIDREIFLEVNYFYPEIFKNDVHFSEFFSNDYQLQREVIFYCLNNQLENQKYKKAVYFCDKYTDWDISIMGSKNFDILNSLNKKNEWFIKYLLTDYFVDWERFTGSQWSFFNSKNKIFEQISRYFKKVDSVLFFNKLPLISFHKDTLGYKNYKKDCVFIVLIEEPAYFEAFLVFLIIIPFFMFKSVLKRYGFRGRLKNRIFRQLKIALYQKIGVIYDFSRYFTMFPRFYNRVSRSRNIMNKMRSYYTSARKWKRRHKPFKKRFLNIFALKRALYSGYIFHKNFRRVLNEGFLKICFSSVYFFGISVWNSDIKLYPLLILFIFIYLILDRKKYVEYFFPKIFDKKLLIRLLNYCKLKSILVKQLWLL